MSRPSPLAVRPWIRDEVAAAVDAIEGLEFSQGPLHTDPAPEAFRWDRERGICGLIDWSTAVSGPLLYDLASALMYLGGPERARPLLDAYLETGALSRDEVDRGLAVMTRFRWAVQADYFARRILTQDLTGIDDGDANEKGLRDARRGLARYSDRS